MKFNATEAQARQVAANAVNASKPMGMGFLHFDSGSVFTELDIPVAGDGSIYLDYVQGRMVKLSIAKREDGYEIRDSISADYQSWICEYPTVEDLVNSVLAPVAS